MSKKPAKRDKRQSKYPPERNAWLTVGWMLTVMTTLACELGAIVLYFVLRGADPIPEPLGALSVVLVMAALILGVIVLLMMPVVLKVRREPVPRPVLMFAIVVGAAPLAMLIVNAAR